MRVYVIEQAIPDADSIASGFSDSGPDVKFLLNGVEASVVAVEGIKGTERGPSCAKRFGSIVSKPAHVGADHGKLEERGKFEDVGYADTVMVPDRQIVSKPLPYVTTRPCELWTISETGKRW